MKNVILMLDYGEGPVWGMRNGAACVPSIIESDPEIRAINDEMGELFDSCYHLDVMDTSKIFDFEQERKDRPRMMELYQRLLERLEKIDDGSFVIEDRLGEELSEIE